MAGKCQMVDLWEFSVTSFSAPIWFPSQKSTADSHGTDVLSEEKRMSYLGTFPTDMWQFNPVRSKRLVRSGPNSWHGRQAPAQIDVFFIFFHHRHLLMRTPPCPTMPQSQKYPKRLEASWCQKMTDIDWSWVGPLVSVSDVSVGTGTPLSC